MALERNVKKKPARTADRRNVWLLILTTLLIVVSVVLFTPPNEKINQGLDIQGGLSVVLTAKSTDGQPVTPEDMEKSRAIIESRVNALGASEATVQEQGSDQILVQIPGLADTEEALATIGRTGSLEFARLDSFTDEDVKNAIDSGQTSGEGTVTDEFGNAFPSGQVEHMAVDAGTYTPIVTGADITNVTIGRESEGSTYYSVNIMLNSQGAKAFADASRDLVADHGKIVIILDGEVQSAPAVQSEIPNGEVSITGQYSLEDAKALQTILESGSLPVSFEYAQSQVVGPTLGQDALVSGVVVALIGLAVVMLYLLFFYKGLGIITAAAMAVFAVLYLGILAALSAFHLFSLSLAGIAGIVLTIGMAADSSILTVERFREEIRMGRSVKAASITGVKHAIFTSIDADLVTMVSALCLFFLAAASVKGFGMTLALGIICDIAMMLIFKAPLIRLLAPKVIAKHPGFWGIKDSIDASKGYAELAAAEGVPEAEAETEQQLNCYADVCKNALAMPVVKGRKTDKEKFAGAEATYTIECMMKDHKALQSGTSHFFGDKFSRAYDVTFTGRDNTLQYPFQTSWGTSTRLIGAIIMTHSDNHGLVLPPVIAPTQVVVIPIAQHKEGVLEAAAGLRDRLTAAGIRVSMDDSDQSAGWKFAQYEMKGVPLRVEIGPKDMEKGQCCIARRDTGEKTFVPLTELESAVQQLLQDVHDNLYAMAEKNLEDNTFDMTSWEEVKEMAQGKGGFARTKWCGSLECELAMKEKAGVSSRCMPLKQSGTTGKCVVCGKACTTDIYWGVAY